MSRNSRLVSVLALAVPGYILITAMKRHRGHANVPLVEIVIGIRSRNKRVDAAPARYRKRRARGKFVSDIALELARIASSFVAK